MTRRVDGVETRGLTAKNWADLKRLFGPRGACSGCWCMWYRSPRSVWKKQKGEGNRRAFEKLVATGAPTGVLAYLGTEPVGWCAVAPRKDYVRLARSHVLKPVDDRPVWSVTCFYIAKAHRRRGLSEQLLRAAVEYAHQHGGEMVEGYPHDRRGGEMPDTSAYSGFFSAFRKAGFKEVARRSAHRPIIRRSSK